jgi:leucyl-tRNA---protein transferase
MPEIQEVWEFPCAYIPGKSMRHAIFWDNPSGATLDFLLADGWRHFGEHYFKHACVDCNACAGLRINPQEFTPSRSHKRNLIHNSDLMVHFEPSNPPDAERLKLINQFQQGRTQKVGWKMQHYSAEDYAQSFMSFDEFSYEMHVIHPQYGLIAISICDITSKSYNAIYTFYNPEFSDRALGIFCILKALELAKSRNLEWVYLGQYNAQCPSLEYKAQFKPHQIMDSL